MSLLELIEQQGQQVARAQQEMRETLDKLHESNAKLSEEIEERWRAERRLRLLCETMSRRDTSLSERIVLMLREACADLDLEVGILARIDGDKYTVVHSWADDPEKLDHLQPGTSRALEDTFCRALDRDGTSIGIEDICNSDWKNTPAYLKSHMETYLGVCVALHGEFWGSLCFIDLSPRNKPFNPPDHDFLRLLAQWIGSELSLRYPNNE